MQTRYYSLMHSKEIKPVPGAQELQLNLMGASGTINAGNHTVGDVQTSMAYQNYLFGGLFDDGFLPGNTGGLGGLGGDDSDGGGGPIDNLPTTDLCIGCTNPNSTVTPAKPGQPGGLAGVLGIDINNLLGNVFVGAAALLLIGLGIYVLFGKEINQVVIDTAKTAGEAA